MGALISLFGRFGANKQEPNPRSERRVSDRVPVIRHDDDNQDDEPTMGGGAAVRTIQFEPGADVDPTANGEPRLVATAAGKTDPGMRRPTNEDALLVLRDPAVYAVADGMGGHAGGEVASQLAIEAMATAFLDGAGSPCLLASVPHRAAELVQSLAAANEAVRSAASRNPRLSDMGTTVVALRFCAEEGRLYVAHVGDSRCYRLRGGLLEQITRDHTMAELGMTGREAGFLSRAVGPKGVVEADVTVLSPRAGDVYLLCTDGLTKMVSDQVICGVLQREEHPQDAANALVDRANAAGGRDNITTVVVSFAELETKGGVEVA